MSPSGSDASSTDELPASKKQRYLTFSERYFTPLYKLNGEEEAKSDKETSNSDSSKESTPAPLSASAPVPAPAPLSASAPTPALTSSLPDASSSPQDHVKILLHSNGICVLTLAPSHPILTQRLKVTKVDFQVSKRVNRLQNSVRGKGKKGGQFFADDKQVSFGG